ncbi:hypothetical protein BCR34DRAFT_605156 [Clohesyomyces aquaticus]|uniref:Uncharacterized protein n=1 Tax=Clohesyomyces aquaticus TaxID=1231657 RepID=A0A1Y1Z143_9PLEO|nr:hypothetical protein BCR34DRAFT_605156 [Clohesyomyces aquaticus]
MTPPKRALFVLNVDSQTEHLFERIEFHNEGSKDKEGSGADKVKVIDQSEPSSGSTRVEIVTRPFEKAVQRTIERVCDGKVVREGNYKKKRDIEEDYDTSDL